MVPDGTIPNCKLLTVAAIAEGAAVAAWFDPALALIAATIVLTPLWKDTKSLLKIYIQIEIELYHEFIIHINYNSIGCYILWKINHLINKI